MDAIFPAVVNRSITAGFLILGVFLLRFLLRNTAADTRRVLWALLCVRLLCPWTFFSGIERISVLCEGAQVARDAGNLAAEVAASVLGSFSYPSVQLSSHDRHCSWISLLWLAGCAALLLRACAGYLRLLHRTRAALRVEDGLWICDGVSSPFVLGFWKPRIILPSDLLEKEQYRFVAAHERAHVQYGDCLWKLAGYVMLSVFWFHPLFWAAYFAFCRDLELSCDEKAIQDLSMEERKKYARVLLDYSGQKQTAMFFSPSFGANGIKRRILFVLRYKKKKLRCKIAAGLLCGAAGIAFWLLPDFELSGQAQEAEEKTAKDAGLEILTDGVNVGFELAALSPGETQSYPNQFYLEKGETLHFSVVYMRAGMAAEAILTAEDGSELTKEMTGGCAEGDFLAPADGWYRFGIRCSQENAAFEETAILPLEISGTVVFGLG